MSIQVALHHRTTYRYDKPVALGPQVVRLRPAPHARTSVLSYSLTVEPKQHFINWQQDPQGNHLARLVFPEKTELFEVVVDLIADMTVINPFDFFLEPEAEQWPFAYDASLAEEIAPFRKVKPPGPLLSAWLAKVDRSKQPTVDFLVGLNARLQQEIGYIVRLEPGVQDCEETLSLAKGSCRDTGWLLVTILRHLGFAARFASGYLIQLMPDEKPLEGPEGPTHDFTDLHAWCEVYLPGAGWIGLDPTSGLLTGEGHIPLACTPEPSSAAPIEGAVEQAEVTFSYDMTVTRVRETPRTTKPYSDEQWATLLAVGEAIERDIGKGDVRLTMGGEPTFVSIDDMDGEEWNTLALGPEKRRLAGVLFRRLADRFATGPLLHFGQGKWYPGEQLPRWALGCHWRKDGEAIWRDPASLCAGVQADGRHARDGASLCAGLRATIAARSQLPVRRLRGHLVLPVARAAPAEQRHGRHGQGAGPDGARAPGAGVREGSRQFRRLRAAGFARPWTRAQWQGAEWPWRSLAQRAVVPALGEVLPDPGRFADRLPPAARFAALDGAGGRGVRGRARSDGAASRPAAAGSLPPCAGAAPPGARAGCRDQRRRRSTPRGLAAGAGARPCRQAGQRYVRHRHRAQRHGLRTARRPPLRLHAADGTHRGLPRSRYCRRGHRRGARPAGIHRGLSAARQRSAPAPFQRDARSRRHRGQHPSLARAGARSSARPRSSTRRRARPGWARRSSWSTAATPAPAAATT